MKKFILGSAFVAALAFIPVFAAEAGSCTKETKPCLSVYRSKTANPSQANVWWQAPAEANSSLGGKKTVQFYRLQVSDTPNFKKPLYTGSYGSTSALLTKLEGVKPLGKFYVRVRAHYTNKTKSKWSTPDSFYSGTPKMKNPKVKSRKKNSVVISWKQSKKMKKLGVYYDIKVFKKKKGADKLVTQKTVLGTNSARIYGVKKGKKYYYRLRARDTLYGDGDWSVKYWIKGKKK